LHPGGIAVLLTTFVVNNETTLQRTGEILQQLGLSRNEARAYMALLACQPASAYEIAKQSAIPSSGDDEHGKRYVALPPEDFMRQVRQSTRDQTRELLPLLTAIGEPAGTDFIWPLVTAEQVATRANELIGDARDWILISAWPEELAWLRDSLAAAEARGLKIALVHFGRPGLSIGATYHHPVEKTLYAEKGGRGLTLVADSQEVIIANFRADGRVDGAWSRNQSFVTVAEDYVKHDVYITKVTRFLDDAVTARFGPEYERLRDVFDADA